MLHWNLLIEHHVASITTCGTVCLWDGSSEQVI